MSMIQPPVAPRRDHVRSLHGDDFHDPYEWLREKTSDEVISYLEAENAYTDTKTAHLHPLIDDIFAEIKNRTQETDLSVARFCTDTQGRSWWYYNRSVEGKDYAISCRCPATDRDHRPDPDGDVPGEQVILDGNVEAEGKKFFVIGGFSISPNGDQLAFLVDNTGDERYTVNVRNLETGTDVPVGISDVAAGIDWAGDHHLVYTRVDEAWRPHQIWCHDMGTDASADVKLYQEDDDLYWMGVGASNDRRWLVIEINSKTTGEAWLIDTTNPTAKPRCVAPRRQGVDYSVEPAGDRLLIVHNDGAVDYQVAQAPLEATSHEQWETVLPGEQGVRYRYTDSYNNFVVVGLRRDGLTGLHIMPRDEQGNLGTGHDISFDEPVYTVDYMGDVNVGTDRITINFTSLITPQSVYEYVVDSKAMRLLKQTPVLNDPIRGAYNPDDYEQKRVWAPAADGTRIPLSIVHKKGITLDGTNPLHLYAYGSYEISVDPRFSIERLTLLERGVVCAIAHIRGGGEMGRTWYDAGKMMCKRTTFTDFVDCAKHVIAQGYTSPERLSIEGRSAGGLLMGAVLNLAPELFRCAHAGVPFVDALTSMVMPELPLTTGEWEEWGDPLHNAEAYAYMKTYTPYENIRPVEYPSILITTSLNDTRVLYVEPAKWLAELRNTAIVPQGREFVMKCEMVAGHAGVSGRYEKWREWAFEYAWVLDQLGITQ